MARKKSEFLSGFGKALEIFKRLVDAVLAKGGGDEELNRILTDDELVGAIADLIMAGTKKAADSFTVTVDYDLSLAEMIELGRYGWVDGDITLERFPIAGKGKVSRKLVLVHLGREATTNEALAEMKRRGLKPAVIEDIFAFGAAYSEEQRKFSIIGLGSSWVDAGARRHFPCLDKHDGKRRLCLYRRWDGIWWNEHYRFLALCE